MLGGVRSGAAQWRRRICRSLARGAGKGGTRTGSSSARRQTHIVGQRGVWPECGAAMAAAAARVPFPHARGCAPAIPPARSSGSPGAVVQMGQAAGSGSVPACVRLPMDCVSHDK
ncbi:hypothetical protein GQ55_8G112500 [Panicum hallii var. hallii]|uniref:Uncharacterized protein n=1 Tax=Panicum hallii var. hallii TaxID=1504633 RepID=A0A2T7CMR6_9POAL|nr:hypothetical protein GQ55_8G112500 [Panicum hallii var. hallii]